MILARSLVVAASVLSFTAFGCGSGGGGGGGNVLPGDDTANESDTSGDSQGTPDTDQADVVQDTGPGNDDVAVPEGCDRADFNAAVQNVNSPQTKVVVYQASNTKGEPFDMLTFEFYQDDTYGGATGPGDYSLDGTNYSNCGNCLRVRIGCTADTCEKMFYASEGTLHITEWSETGFKGSLEGVVAQEVTIDPQTYTSTPVKGGESWCLDGFQFDANVQAPPDLPPTESTGDAEPTCVADGNGNFVGDNVEDFTLQNCLGEEVSLHDTCGEYKALWLMGTAGWCTACEATIAQLASQHGGSLSRQIIRDKTPGLDMLIILGENTAAELPTLDYCKAYAAKNSLDPAMVLIDHNPDGVQVPLISPPGYAVEAKSLATVWTAMNPYLTANSAGQVQSAFPWMALLKGSNMEYWWSDYVGVSDLNAKINELLAEP